ncbi:MAG: DUF3168 domain-containing protein [Candidatus Rokuibacteriota bacterium]|nr:MAG: DUF3168 domain-containing protein [Candidatus Rokubacteria bacterium]
MSAYISTVHRTGVPSGGSLTLSAFNGGGAGQANRCLWVAVLWPGTTTPVLNSLTYGGVALTLAAGVQAGGVAIRTGYLVAPAGTADIVATFNTAPNVAWIVAKLAGGIHQATPLRNGPLYDVGSGEQNLSTALSAAVTAADLVLDALYIRTQDAAATLTPGTGQTPADLALSELTQGSSCASSHKTGAPSTAMAWTWTTGFANAHQVAVALADAGAAPNDTTLGGECVGAATVTGGLATVIALAGSPQGVATLAGALVTSVALGGSALGTASLAGTLGDAIALAGSAQGVATAIGALATAIVLGGTAAGVAAVSAALATALPLGGRADGLALAEGALATAIDLGADVQALGVLTGDLLAERVLDLGGDARGEAVAMAWLATSILLGGDAAGHALLRGDLLAIGQPPIRVAQLVTESIVTRLRGDQVLQELLDQRIYTFVPPGAPFPLLRVEGMVCRPFERMGGGHGYEITVQLRASSQAKGDWEVHAISDRVRQVLDAHEVPLPPCRASLWAFDPGGAVYTDLLAGVLTYHRPDQYRVRVTL